MVQYAVFRAALFVLESNLIYLLTRLIMSSEVRNTTSV
jgi:hypothetical protein